MKKFLDDLVGSTGYGASKVSGFRMDEVKISKAAIDGLVERLRGGVFSENFSPTKPNVNSVITPTIISGNFSQAEAVMDEIFNVLNWVVLTNNANISTLFAESRAMERELKSIEKAIENYAFLLADGKAFDFAYLESFDDLDGFDQNISPIPDRTNNFYSFQLADVHKREGKLLMVPSIDNTLQVSERYLRAGAVPEESGPRTAPYVFPIVWGLERANNAGAKTQSADWIWKSHDSNINTGWHVRCKSASSISNPLPEFVGMYSQLEPAGLQVLAEYGLQSPTPCDFVRVDSHTSGALQITQLRLFPDAEDESVYIDVLDSPRYVNDSAITLTFPKQTVHKFQVFFRRVDFNPENECATISETIYRGMESFTEKRLMENIASRPSDVAYARTFNLEQHLADGRFMAFDKSNSQIMNQFKPSHGSMASDDRYLSRQNYSDELWNDSDPAVSMFKRASSFALSTEVANAVLGNTPRDLIEPFSETPITSAPMHETQAADETAPSEEFTGNEYKDATVSSNYYRYEFTVKEVRIGLGGQQSRAVYVSNPIITDGDVGEVMIKVSDEDYLLKNSDRDSNQLTSIEYSVSNVSNPVLETDWRPIMPVTKNTVEGERLFIDAAGKAFTRFPMSFAGDISIYKNGYDVKLPIDDVLVRADNKRYYNSVRFPLGTFVDTDIFTIDYTPAGDFSRVDFSSTFNKKPLMASFDSDGVGERFTGTTGNREVMLAQYPYVDYNQLANSTYSATAGYSPYNPIVVKFDDGTVAYNLTDYNDPAQQSSLDETSSDYQFLHSENVLIFNKKVTSPFRVYYKFLPSNLRFRVVLRCNNNLFVSPKVDYVQIKAKTRKADVKKL